VLVIAEMSRRRYPADSAEAKRAFLKTDAVASQMEAVQKNRIITIDAQAMDPGIRTIEGVEQVAQGLKAFGLAY
jgi:iron complex transport system substrate-binding protein